MQRRLCVLIASLGNPELLLFDEPSTGLDPVSRRQIWRLIQGLKSRKGPGEGAENDRGKVIVLTTHDMAEAEFLSDKIGILSKGSLKTLGTSLSLKNRFGSGFRLNLNIKSSEAMDEVLTFLSSRLPGAKVLIRAGTNLTVGVPRSIAAVMPEFLKCLEGKLEPVTQAVSEFGIANSTLEEVFLNITAGERVVETGITVGGDGEEGEGKTSKKSAGEDGGKGGGGKGDGTLCVLCCQNEASCVVAFTQGLIPFLVDGVLCSSCAEDRTDPALRKGMRHLKIKPDVAQQIRSRALGGFDVGDPDSTADAAPEAAEGGPDADSLVDYDSPRLGEDANGGRHSTGVEFRPDDDIDAPENFEGTHEQHPPSEVSAAVSVSGADSSDFSQQCRDWHRFTREIENGLVIRCGEGGEILLENRDPAITDLPSVSQDGPSRPSSRSSASSCASYGSAVSPLNPFLCEGEHHAAVEVETTTAEGNRVVVEEREAAKDNSSAETALSAAAAGEEQATGSADNPSGAFQDIVDEVESDQIERDQQEQVGPIIKSRGHTVPATRLFASQFHAILLKNYQHMRRERRANCCRCCLIFLCSFFSVVFMFWLGMLGKKRCRDPICRVWGPESGSAAGVPLTEFDRNSVGMLTGMFSVNSGLERTIREQGGEVFDESGNVVGSGRRLANSPTTGPWSGFGELLLETADTYLSFLENDPAQMGEESAVLPDATKVSSEQEYVNLYTTYGGTPREVTPSGTTPSTSNGDKMRLQPGYPLSYCGPQNQRFSHVNPTKDFGSGIGGDTMYKSVLLESYNQDESKFYKNSPAPLLYNDRLKRSGSFSFSGEGDPPGATPFPYEYQHSCRLWTESCPVEEFSWPGARETRAVSASGNQEELEYERVSITELGSTSQNSYTHDGRREFRLKKCGGSNPVVVPQLGNLRGNRKSWRGREEIKVGAAQWTGRKQAVNQIEGDLQCTAEATSDVNATAPGTTKCKAAASQYATVNIWVERDATSSNPTSGFDESWLGIPTNSKFWANQARYSVQNIAIEDVTSTGISAKFTALQEAKKGRSKSEGENKCLLTSVPGETLYTNAETSAGALSTKGVSAPLIYGSTDVNEEELRMGSSRFLFSGDRSAGTNVGVSALKYERLNMTSNETAAAALLSDPVLGGVPKKEFPDISLTVQHIDGTKGKIQATVHVVARDAGYEQALFRKQLCGGNCTQQDYTEGILGEGQMYSGIAARNYRPSLYDSLYLVTAHGPGQGAASAGSDSSAADCNLDFLTPTSYMQLHTLISGLANGVRGKIGKTPVLGEVLSHPPLWLVHAQERLGMGTLLWVSACTLVSFLFFPLLTFTVASERRSGLLALMKVQGLLPLSYWLANYFFFFVSYGLTLLFYFAFLSSIAGSGSEVMKRDWSELIGVLLTWGHAQTGLAFFLSYVLSNSDAIVGATYLIIILTILAAQVFVLVITPPWPRLLFFYPPLNFVRSISLWIKTKVPGGVDPQTGAERTLQTELTVSEREEFSDLVLIQALVGSFLCLISAGLHMGWHEVVGQWVKERSLKQSKGVSDTSNDSALESTDTDVIEEYHRIKQLKVGEEPIRISHLKKLYPGAKRPAVNGVSFGVKRGECFGLLGPNGAGKTSLINMLTSNMSPTGGFAEVAGYDIFREGGRVQENLGFCPQFDCIWERMSVQEHLEFYARLRGVGSIGGGSKGGNGSGNGGREGRISVGLRAQHVADLVGLSGDNFKMQAGELSGGGRRRLSIGISLVGDPPVVLLDEPSSGLDPETRNGIWRVVALAARSRALLITTHSMEEADALCNRIGIVCGGELQCLGTPLHLKSKFGSGYTVTIALGDGEKEPESRGKEFQKLLGSIANRGKARADVEVRILPSTGSVLQIEYNVGPPEQEAGQQRPDQNPSINLASIFERLEAERLSGGLREWSVRRTSLDEVFLRIITEHSERTGLSN